MSRIELIGIDGPALTGKHWSLLRRCAAIVVSRRHRPLVTGLGSPLIDIAPLVAMLNRVKEILPTGDVAILANGDPLFYGIGRTLTTHFTPEQINVHPALSSVQLACARFRVPWDDLALVSLHGRSGGDIPDRILRHGKVMLFTDPHNSPDHIAATLLTALSACEDWQRIEGLRIRVAENLGLAEERLIEGNLSEIAAQTFAPLNLMLVEQPNSPDSFRFGLRENEIRHSRGLITKDEIRAATLHRLRLPPTGVFWDIGGGSGSVSLEAARLNPDLSIYTVEKKPEEQSNIKENIRRYGAYNIHLINGEAPEALSGLPAPDRIFIGGSGQRLEAVIEAAVARLAEDGRIVVNAVLATTETTALVCLQRLHLQVESSTLAVTRREYPDGEIRIFNPITLITGGK